MNFMVGAVFFVLTVLIQWVYSETKGSPIVLVPGYGGTQLFAKLQNSEPPHFYCESTSSDYFLIWVAIKYLGPLTINCFLYRMILNYDPVSKMTYPPKGVSIQTQNFGDTSTIDYLTQEFHITAATYYGILTSLLVEKSGYVRNVSVRGVPYDFRKAPDENQDVIDKMKILVEDTYKLNGNKKVILIGHSMGCLYSLHFLQQQSQAWKDKYIKLYISAAGPYAGSVKMIKATASGDNLDINTVKSVWLKNLSRTWPGSAYMLPHQKYWTKEDILAMTDKRNYTAYDYKEFYDEIGYPAAYDNYKRVGKITDPEIAPGVEVHCVYSSGVPTPLIYDWRGQSFPDSEPKAINCDGDGTVNLRSLTVCLKWSDKQSQAVKKLHIPNVDHFELIKTNRFYHYVRKLAFSDQNQT